MISSLSHNVSHEGRDNCGAWLLSLGSSQGVQNSIVDIQHQGDENMGGLTHYSVDGMSPIIISAIGGSRFTRIVIRGGI